MPSDRLAALTAQELRDELFTHLTHLTAASGTNIGFPAATDIDVVALYPFLRYMLNNLGDPDHDGQYPLHTKGYEIDVVDIVADLLGLPDADR